MKKVTLFLSLLFVTALVSKNASAQIVSGAKIEFSKETHDYGTVKYGGDGTCTFDFTNTGTEPLIISNAKGSCGCTVPDWPKEPIAPGATGTIKVSYDTKRPGAISKSVTITSNDASEPTKVIRITGNVLPAPEGAAPVNNSGAPSNN
jgi:hypothetical protein